MEMTSTRCPMSRKCPRAHLSQTRYVPPFLGRCSLSSPPRNPQPHSHDRLLALQDRIPWLRTIRHTAIELTSPAGVAAVASSSNSGSSTDTDDPPALTKALQHVHPATKGLGDKTTSRPRAAVVIGCSALRRPYRQLLSGKHAVMRDGLEEPASDNQGLETYFLYCE